MKKDWKCARKAGVRRRPAERQIRWWTGEITEARQAGQHEIEDRWLSGLKQQLARVAMRRKSHRRFESFPCPLNII